MLENIHQEQVKKEETLANNFNENNRNPTQFCPESGNMFSYENMLLKAYFQSS